VTEICRGKLIERECDGSKPRLERVLAVDNSCSQVVTIRIVKERVLPLLWPYQDIIDEIKSGHSRIIQDEPFAHLLIPEDGLSEAKRRMRDERWQIISQLPCQDIEFMVYPWKRGPAIKDLADRTGKNKDYIYDKVRRYWQGGMVINALSPDLDKRGGPSKQRLVEEQDGTKFGRSSSLELRAGRVLKIKLTPLIVRCFERGTLRFLIKKGTKYQLKAAFDRITETFFIRTLQPIEGIDKPELLPANERPKFRQYEHWFRKYGIKITRKSRNDKSEPNTKKRALLGDSTQMAFGPGSLYQIDAMIGNIYLVSSFDRTRIIGKPVIYFIMDVFSRMIIGMTVTLEGPSWRCAMLAVENIVKDKVEFCKKFGLDIDESEWPCNRLGNGFLADRGEFEGYAPEPLIKNCNQTVKNTRPYKGELKGIIERNNGRAKEKTIKFAPGLVVKDRRPGEPDYRLDAAVTQHVFTRTIIRYVLWYNNNHYLKKYNMKEFQIWDKVPRYPIDLWYWGIRNRSGNFGHINLDVLRKNLLPHKEVTITPQGISFGKGLFYTCETATRDQWFDRAADEGTWKEVASYKYDSMDKIYLWADGGARMEDCYLVDRVKDPFFGHSYYEIEDYQTSELENEETSQTRRQQASATLMADIQRDFEEEKEKTKAALEKAGPISKRSRIKNISANRRDERDFERHKATEREGSTDQADNTVSILPVESQENLRKASSYIPPDADLNALRELREEAWNDER
jgi:putative transposase